MECELGPVRDRSAVAKLGMTESENLYIYEFHL